MFAEMINNRLVSRFAEHQRFICWINNVYFRHRTLDQGDIYLKQCKEDENLTLDDIRLMIKNNNVYQLLARI
jgi:hypothetical protein